MENQESNRIETEQLPMPAGKPRRKHRVLDLGRLTLFAALPFLFLWMGMMHLEAQSVRTHASALAEFSAAIEELCDAVSPAVVEIEVRLRAPVDNADGRRTEFFAKQSASGSGVIVDAGGYILTNAHVVEGSRDIDVSVADTSAPGRKDANNHFAARIV
jgi:S1-C subfamily serine protease